MKNNITLMIILTTLLSSSLINAATSIKAEVNGMVCAFCAKGIEKKLNTMPERKASFVDLKSRIVILEVKDSKNVPLTQFSKVIEEAGYTVGKVEVVQKSAADLQAQILKDKRVEK